MSKPKIKPVTDNYNKGKNYSQLIEKYSEAIKAGFYGEAELIVYAFLEDRLRSFIYYSNGLDHWNSKSINEDMQKVYGGELQIYDMGCKLTVIEEALKIAGSKGKMENEYFAFLKTVYNSVLDISEFKNAISDIRKWCGYRNEIIHAMFNKDLDDLRKGFKEHVEDGFRLARFIDAQVAKLKKA